MSTYVNNNVLQTSVTTGTLGSAAGHVIFTNNVLPGLISSVKFIYTATATVGNRSVTISIKDSSGNVIWLAVNGTSQTAGQSFNYVACSTNPVIAAGGVLTLNLASPAYLPPNGTVTILDSGNIDVNDNIVSGQIVVQY